MVFAGVETSDNAANDRAAVVIEYLFIVFIGSRFRN
jgi:hypothetical protein